MTHPHYNQDLHGPYETHNIGTLTLEEGGALRDCHLAYATFGKLNKAKSNAVLITTWYSGTSKIMEQAYVGAGRALDPAKYFIIIVNTGCIICERAQPHWTPTGVRMHVCVLVWRARVRRARI